MSAIARPLRRHYVIIILLRADLCWREACAGTSLTRGPSNDLREGPQASLAAHVHSLNNIYHAPELEFRCHPRPNRLHPTNPSPFILIKNQVIIRNNQVILHRNKIIPFIHILIFFTYWPLLFLKEPYLFSRGVQNWFKLSPLFSNPRQSSIIS